MDNKSENDSVRNKMKDYLLNNDMLIDCHVLHQNNKAYDTIKKKYNTNDSGICGYVATGVATFFSEKLTSIKHDNTDVFIELCLNVNSSGYLNYIEKTVQFIQGRRQNVIEPQFIDEKPLSGWYNNWIKGWVSNYEISDYMKEIKMPNIHFFRFNQIRDLENILSDKERNDPIGHYEFSRIEEEYNLNRFDNDKDFYFIETPTGELLEEKAWKYKYQKDIEEEKPIVFIIDCRGHFTVAIPIVIETNNEKNSKVIMFNSLHDENISNHFHGSRYSNLSKIIYDLVFRQA